MRQESPHEQNACGGEVAVDSVENGLHVSLPACLTTTDTTAEAAGLLLHWVGGESLHRDEIPGGKHLGKMCAF